MHANRAAGLAIQALVPTGCGYPERGCPFLAFLGAARYI